MTETLAPPSAAVGARIGPNAVLQTLSALEDAGGPALAAQVRAEAGIPDTFPEGLVPELWFESTVDAVRRRLSLSSAEAVLAEAGSRTAAYVAENRIPGLAKAALRGLPAPWALRLLLTAITRHAWTFAGQGRFAVRVEPEGTVLTLTGSPTCRRPHAVAAGAYYAAAFEGLLALAGPFTVREVACEALGAPCCRFAVAVRT